MEVSTLAGMATDMSTVRLQQTQELSVLKKAIDIEAEGALQLLASVAPMPTLSSTGGTAGQVINTTA